MLKINKGSKVAPLARLLGATALAVLAASGSQAGAQKAGAKIAYLYDFGAATRSYPGNALVQGTTGAMYGEVDSSAAEIYETSPAGAGTVVWASGADDGDDCYNGMTLGTDGMLYGTCVVWENNSNASGVIFQLNPHKRQKGFKVIYTWPAFGNSGSEWPSPLTLGPDGNFYGTTRGDDANEYGTVFQVTPQGVYTTLHVFQGLEQNDGDYPSTGPSLNPIPLTLGSDGNFYGTTDQGGANGGTSSGTTYQITPAGAVTVLYDFPAGDGTYTGIVELNGNFYGQTTLGGTNDEGTIYELASDGSFTTLHSFSKSADNAAFPGFPFTIGTDGNLYDSAQDYYSGGYDVESLYEITPAGSYTDLYHDFGAPTGCSPVANGCDVNSPLLLNTNGRFYGVTALGPNCNECGGTFFRMIYHQTPFVRLQLPVAKAGTWIGMLGQGFTKATSVSFNGKPAKFEIDSDTFVRAQVPAGTSAGRVVVTTPDQTLRSNTDFTPLR